MSIYAALHTVLADHPALACGIVNEDTPKPAYIRLTKIDLRDNVIIRKLAINETLETILAYEHSLLWPHLDARPGWKLLIIPHPDRSLADVSFLFHHALMDGLSGPAFHYALLNALNHPTLPARISPIIEFNDSIELPPPVESKLSLKVTYGRLLSEVFGTYAPSLMQYLPFLSSTNTRPWTGATASLPTPTSPYIAQVRVIDIPSPYLTTILAKCKRSGSSLTAVLHGVIVLSLAKMIPEASAFAAMTPYSVRDMTGTGMGEIVNHVSAVSNTYPRRFIESAQGHSGTKNDDFEGFDPVSIYAIGTHFLNGLRSSKAEFPVDNALSLLQYVGDFHAFFKRKLGNPRAETFEVSNLGVFRSPITKDGGKGGKVGGAGWRVERVLFTQAGAVVGPALGFNVASVKDGLLTISLTWQDGAVESELAEQLLQQVETSLTDLGGGNGN